jgi:hypothetical protein
MAIYELKDRTDRLFGRQADLDRLRARARSTGLTGVVGSAQIGKSWLLMELARVLAAHFDPPCLSASPARPKGRPTRCCGQGRASSDSTRGSPA